MDFLLKNYKDIQETYTAVNKRLESNLSSKNI